MKNYRLAVDENGSPFVLNSKGSIDFGYITEEMNLPPAPIRIAEGFTGPKGYGLKHILEGHEKEILHFGYISVYDFIEDVSANFTEIKEGRDGSYLLEMGDEYHNTLFIALSKECEYWKIISGGIFRFRYSNATGNRSGLSFSVCKYIKNHSKSIALIIFKVIDD